MRHPRGGKAQLAGHQGIREIIKGEPHWSWGLANLSGKKKVLDLGPQIGGGGDQEEGNCWPW